MINFTELGTNMFLQNNNNDKLKNDVETLHFTNKASYMFSTSV